MKNRMGKTRPVGEPYMIYKNHSGWEWRVLKAYQTPDKEVNNPYARWFCAVKSPLTYGEFELGDVYTEEIKQNAICVVPFVALIK